MCFSLSVYLALLFKCAFFFPIVRERLAKAKRLARFKLELDEVTHNKMGGVDVMDNTNRNECSTTERDKYMSSQSLDLSRNLAHGNAISDNDALESSSIIIGLCPDMCPGTLLNVMINWRY